MILLYQCDFFIPEWFHHAVRAKEGVGPDGHQAREGGIRSDAEEG